MASLPTSFGIQLAASEPPVSQNAQRPNILPYLRFLVKQYRPASRGLGVSGLTPGAASQTGMHPGTGPIGPGRWALAQYPASAGLRFRPVPG